MRLPAAICLLVFLLSAAATGPTIAAESPDYLTIGGGDFDFDKTHEKRTMYEYRAEYQSGISLLPLIDSDWGRYDNDFQFHPVVGLEGMIKHDYFGNGGFNMDVPFSSHGIFTWGETVGYYYAGNHELWIGGELEFRSQLEMGWQFDNALRLTGYFSHISNGGISMNNPGAEVMGAYLHIPIYWSAQK